MRRPLRQRLRRDAWRHSWPLLLAGFICLLLQAIWPLAATLAAMLLWQLGEKWRLAHWLEKGDRLDPPHASGLWEGYYTSLTQQFRGEQRIREELTSAIAQARHWADSVEVGVLLLNTEGGLVYFNRSARQLLGLTSKDRHNLLTNLVRHPRLHHYLAKGDFAEPLLLPNQDGSLTLQYHATSLTQRGLLLRVEDVSQLQALENLRRDFVANVSHELKTPITVFKGTLELLNDQLEDEPVGMRLLANLEQQSERMESLVHGLLLLARLERAPNEQRESLALELISNKLMTTFDAKAALAKVSLEWDIAPNISLNGNDKELESAFANLIDNALSYTPVGGRIKVTAREKDGWLQFSVNDNGDGIEASHLPHLTQRFYRVDKSRYRGSGGTGLGLAIVKHALQRHGGHLQIDSRLGEGSCFTCHLPLS